MSGRRAGLTLVVAWLLGSAAVAHLQRNDLLVAAKADEPPIVACGVADPLLYAADAMLPLDLNVAAKCEIGKGPRATVGPGLASPWFSRRVLGELETYRIASATFQVLSWLLLSLAVLTWSGLLKRGGRE